MGLQKSMFISIYVNKFVQINKMKTKYMIQQYYEWNLNETISDLRKTSQYKNATLFQS